jgi:hypothetical protein
MRTLGYQITALIETHFQIKLPGMVPAHVACLIMAAVKANRLAFRGKQDSADDLHNYVDMAQEVRDK